MTHITRRAWALLSTVGLAASGLVALAPASVAAPPTLPPSPGVLVAKMTSRHAVTPTNNNAFGNITGTDIGTFWDGGGGEILSAFGDTYNRQTTSGSWRCSSLLFSSDHDLSDGVSWDRALMDTATLSKQIVPCNKDATGGGAIKPGEHSAIPTAGFAVPNPLNPSQYRNFVAYMSVTEFFGGRGGDWGVQYNEIYYSDDYGATWAQSPMKWVNNSTDLSWATGKGKAGSGYQPFQQVAFAQKPGDEWVYMLGTGPGRYTPAAVARIKSGDLYAMDQAKFEYWITDKWVTPAEDPQAADHATPVILPEALSTDATDMNGIGEMGFAWDAWSQHWIMMSLENNVAITIRTATDPTGPWSDKVVVLDSADYVQLYGGFIHPWSTGADSPDIYFSMSDWRNYNTYLARVSLNKDGTVTRPNLLADPNFERQNPTGVAGRPVVAPWSTDDSFSGLDYAGGSATNGIRAFSGGIAPWLRLGGATTDPGQYAPGTPLSIWQTVTVKPNTNYELNGWVRMNNNSTAVLPDGHVGARIAQPTHDGAVIAQTTFNKLTPSDSPDTEPYQRQHVEFNSGTATSIEVFVGGEASAANPWLNVDAFYLVEKDAPILDKAALFAAIEAAQALSSEAFTTSSWPSLAPVLTESERVYNEVFTDQAEVDAAAAALTAAIAALVPRGDAAALVAVIAFINGLDLTIYTDASVAAVQAAIAAAAPVIAGVADEAQAAVDAAQAAIQTAFAALVLKPTVDIAEPLRQLIDAVDAMAGNADLFTPASWANLSVAVATGRTFLVGTPTPEQVNAAVASIQAAVAGLVPATPEPASVAALTQVVAAASSLVAASYTPESWAALQTALTAANAVLAEVEPSAEDIDAAIVALNAAILGLAPATGGEPDPDGSATTPGLEGSGTPSGAGSLTPTGTSTTGQSGGLPTTGTQTALGGVMLAALMLALGAAFLSARARRRLEQ